MFWKKKEKVDFELDSQIGDHRAAFRIAPDQSKPVIITIAGDSFNALNISGTGVCIRSHNFPVGASVAATVQLSSEDHIFPVTLEVVAKQDDMCRCCFRKISQEAGDLLHAYILELQKAKIRRNQSR
ncbi:MAG: PilZ domain-containing protein [Gammaproteobacteria bacterium]